MVLYSKGENLLPPLQSEKENLRRKNPADKGIGRQVPRCRQQARQILYGNGRILIHEVNGVEKQTFVNHRSIDLYTPTPVPDSYDDWEDYYYDNEEDFRNYYGR